ncbi:MAG: iron ABC transporter permease, partial [Opitutia bacterium]
MTRGAAAILLGAALLAVALMTAVSVGSTGTGWGEGGALAMLRLPRVLAAAPPGLARRGGGARPQGVFRPPRADPGRTG